MSGKGEQPMRKLVALAIFTSLISVFVFPQEDGLTISGEVKTGLYWEEKKDEDKDPVATVKFYNNDDAGTGTGRFRLNLQYEKNNIGMKTRIQLGTLTVTEPELTYAFGYGRFFDQQLELSIGKLGASPWGTGGPEMWEELESLVHGGMRVEYKPSWLSGLNAGFVLNHYDSPSDAGFGGASNVTLAVILQETVLGVSYDHELFAGTFAYRLDSEGDRRDRGTTGKEGDEMLYRLEERVLKNYLSGLKIWANGSWEGVGAESEDCIRFLNWLYGEYAPDNFTAQLRIGYDVIVNRSILHMRPSFYYHFFDKLLSAGTSFTFAQDFGEGKMYADSPFLYWFFEPQIKINFGNMYVALVYHYGQEYKYHTDPPKQQLQWFNLRMALTF
jgi:hypothetical protein